jgi:hypothetical protein
MERGRAWCPIRPGPSRTISSSLPRAPFAHRGAARPCNLVRFRAVSAITGAVREPTYLMDFRRMSVEKIADPTPPDGIDTSAPEVPEGTRRAGITFAVRGSEPAPEDES